ncbi:lantibiotic dehydratase family protein [Parapedobacter tibetensis]|nr:lantibiotic dehydratase family protein [Parapedobacter tibetensis]
MKQGYEECNSITSLNLEADALKQTVVNILFDLIGKESNDTARNILLSLKRDVFNNRDLAKYSGIVSDYDDLKKAIDLYISCSFQVASKKEQFEISFKNQLRKSVNTIRESWGQHFLANGILFSSNVLYEEIRKTLPKDSKIDKSNKNLLIAITKYFIRSVTKTTPFSSLNSVFVLELKEKRYKKVDFNQQESRIQISNLIFFRVKEILLGNKNFVRHLIVKPNSAICKEIEDDEFFHFFVNVKNNEYFKKAKKNAVVIAIIELAKQSVHHRDLEDLIAIKYPQGEETIGEFLNALIDVGILILQFPVAIDNMEWVNSLIDFIDRNKLNLDLEVLKVRSFLVLLRSTVLSLESTHDISKRRQYMDDCSRQISKALNFDGTCDYLNKLVLSKNLFYENVFTTSDVELESIHIEAVQDRIREVFFALNCISLKERSISFLYRYMVQNGVKRMPLLEAYTEIYLKNKKAIDSENVDFDAANVILDKLLAELAKGDGDRPIDISSFVDRSSIVIDNNIKFGAFVQFINNKFEDVIINSFSGGFGSNVSRYLGFCPTNVLERCREYVINCEKDSMVADVRDASIHNSNSFPILANYTIDIASSDTDSNEDIPLNSLFLAVCDDNKVRIINGDGVVVKPVNFSMEAVHRKSKFTQFLDLFNSTDLFGYSYLMQRIGDFLINSAFSCNVHMSPRIIFDRKIILKRKQWHIKVDYLRSYIGVFEERPEVFCLKLNAFIRDYSIPSEVFVKFSHTRKRNDGQSYDSYKPFYINFVAPLSILVFMNMLNKSDSVLELSEVLPALPSATESSPGRVREYVMSL